MVAIKSDLTNLESSRCPDANPYAYDNGLACCSKNYRGVSCSGSGSATELLFEDPLVRLSG